MGTLTFNEKTMQRIAYSLEKIEKKMPINPTCEWVGGYTEICNTACGYLNRFTRNEDFRSSHYKFCPWCGKTIQPKGTAKIT